MKDARRNWPGRDLMEKAILGVLSERTYLALKFDLLRLRARIMHNRKRDVDPGHRKLHVGCGDTLIPGWLNVDVILSDYDVDLGCGRLPWRDRTFEAAVSQHVVEHLDLLPELLPLLKELRRVLKPGAALWLSCPDLEKVCRSYMEHAGADFLKDKMSRYPDFSLGHDSVPAQHMINFVFHESGRHKNLYDFTILDWALSQAGFKDRERVSEADLLRRFPEFPRRNDDFESIYVRAVAP